MAKRRPDKTPDRPRRTPAALIELIQTHLPQELSQEQIDELRAKLDDRPELQEALQAELSAQQDPAPEHARTTSGFDELIARIEALAAGPRPKRRLIPALGRGVALVLAVVVILLVFPPHRYVDPMPGGGAASRPATAPTTRLAATTSRPATAPTTRLAAASRPTTAPTTRLAATDPPGKGPAGTSTTRPHVPLTPSPMTWQEYALPGTKGASDWQGGVETLFERRSGKEATLRSRKYLELDGTYGLGAVPARGRMLRLGFWETRQFDLELWNGNAGVRLQMEQNMSGMRGYALTRDRPGGQPAITGSFHDRGAWRWYGRGAIDLRYQNAEVLICRGEVPLLRLPMPKPPAEGSLTCSRARLWVAEARDCRPLVLTGGRMDKVPITRTAAGKLTWQMDPSDKTKLAVGEGGVAALSSEQDNDEGRAWFALDAPAMGSLETTIHVRDCTALAGIFARAGDSACHIRLYSHKSKRVVGSGDRQQMDEDIRVERTVGKEFRVRIRFGLDVMMVWISPDGERWWPRQEQPFNGRPGQVQIGLEVLRGKGPRRVAVDDVTIRRFGSIRRMVGADGQLVAEASSALTKEVLSASSRAQALVILEEPRRDDVDAGQWRTACDVNLAGRSRYWQVRAEALRELFLARCLGADADVQAVLAALEELLETAHVEKSELPRLVRDVLGALGRSCLEAGKTRQMKTVMDATCLRPGPMALPGGYSAEVMPPGLLSLYVLDLMARGEWASVRLESLRAIFMAYGRDRQTGPPLAQWALREAEGRLSDTSGTKVPAAGWMWQHPLVANDDREILNVLGEFVFLVKGKHYESACKTITSRTLGDGLVFLGGEQDILQTSHFLIRETIRTTPALREVLRQRRYSDIGMIRLERARRQNDVSTIRSLAVQFYGTAPGLGAMHVLADRDLSSGDFRGAAARYKVLQAQPDYPRRSDAAAKYRLAWAMLGRLVGRPVTKPVVLSGGTFSGPQFEQMIQELASARKSADQALAVGVDAAAPAPGGNEARLTHVVDVSGVSTGSRYSWVRPTCFAADGDRLIVSHAGKLFAIDPVARRIVWTFEPDPKRRIRRGNRGFEGPARLLRVNGRLYVRCAEAGRPLACFETKTGTRLWSRQYDDRVLSDPILIDSSISVITTRRDVSSTLYLRRVSADGNELSPLLRLVQIADGWAGLGRPAVLGDAILFRTAGCLVNCSRRGALRWARRLPMVPPKVMPQLHAGMTLDDMLVWRGKNGERNVILSAPGSPYVVCVSAENGKLLWSRLIHSAARVVGLVGGSAIVLESDRICALDPATGKILWQYRASIENTAVLPAEKDTLVLVRLDRPRGAPGERREIRWLSARSGDTDKVLQIGGDSTIYDVSTLFSDGKRIFGLSNFVAASSSKGKVFMIEIPG